MLWAIEDAPVDDHGALLVLIALADRAADDGTAAWPSRDWLAVRARCSARSVQRKLGLLRDLGVIVPGDQELVSHVRPDRRPVVYDLNLALTRGTIQPPTERGDSLSPRGYGETNRVATGRQTGSHGETALAHKPSLVPTGLNPTQNTPRASDATPPALQLLTAEANTEADDFAAFWAAYPRKIAKPAGRKAYARARKAGVPAQVILDAVKDHRGGLDREARYVPYPATWLNNAHWEDEVGQNGYGSPQQDETHRQRQAWAANAAAMEAGGFPLIERKAIQ